MAKEQVNLRELSEPYLTDSEREKLDSGFYKLKNLCTISHPEPEHGIIGYRIGILRCPGLETVRDFYAYVYISFRSRDISW